MKYLILASLLVSSTVFSSTCRPIPNGPSGRPIQTFQALTGEREPRNGPDIFGDDLVYQGGECPAEKICIESVNSVYGNEFTTHGQVIIIDSASGNVEQIVPIRVNPSPAPAGQSIAESGIHLVNQNRLDRLCNQIRNADNQVSSFCGRVDRSTGERNVNDRANLDTYSYGVYSGNRQVSGGYVPLTPESRSRVIQALNSGNRTNSVAFVVTNTNARRSSRDEGTETDWSQVNSIQRGSAGTLNRLSKVVGKVRARLGCEPTATNPEIRLRQAALDAREGLAACGLTYDLGNGFNTSIRCTSQCSLARPISVNLTPQGSSEYECKSKFRGDVETITCKYQDVNSKVTQSFRVQNGRLLGVELKDSQVRGEFSCNVAEAVRPARGERSQNGSRVRGE